MTDTADVSPGTWFVENDELFVSSDGWLRFPRPRPEAEARLICFPPAGAEAFMYDRWVNFLPESLELCAVQLPEGEEYNDVQQVIATLSESIVEQSRAGQKLIFCGICLGALWAYESARYLRATHNVEIAHLIVVTYPAPDQQAPTIAFMRTSNFINIMTSYFPAESPEHQYVLSRLPSMMYAADLAEQNLPPFDRPLDCPITAFASIHDQVIDPQVLSTWKPYTTGSFHVHMCDGDHFYGDHHMEEFLQALVGYLEASGLQKV
ncbi:MAG TPA: thioesterase domain-containing protein [Herpetosiphonaceae bacterium]